MSFGEGKRSPWRVKSSEKRLNLLVKWNIDTPSSQVNKFTFGQNTITVHILPIIMTHGGVIPLDGGDSISITGATNSFLMAYEEFVFIIPKEKIPEAKRNQIL
jgi:hypothetical protein